MPMYWNDYELDVRKWERCCRQVEAAMRASGWQSGPDKFNAVARKRAKSLYWRTP